MGSIINIDNLRDVKPFKTSWRVQVKVLHTWKSFHPLFGASLEMVLSDENGVKIQASCKSPFIQYAERHCRVGEWIVINNFALSAASGFDRVTNHLYKMSFLFCTTFSESAVQCDNMFLNLEDFGNIRSGSCNKGFLIDVIGEVIDFSGLDVVQCHRKEIKNMEFTLRDINDQRLKCCLWGQFAEFLTSQAKVPNNGDICLIRFAKILKCKGEFQVSNTFESSLVLLNPDIPETQALNVFRQSKEAEPLIQQKRKQWSQTPFKTIQQIKRTAKGGDSRVICTVYAIDADSGWYYFACVVCNHKVRKMTISFNDLDIPDWWCECCRRIVTKVSPRYKLHLLVQDLTGESSLMLLDSAENTIVNASAAKLLNGSGDKNEVPELPSEIVDIVGKTYGFGISGDENNIVGVSTVEAMKVWNLDDILLKRIKSMHQLSFSMKKHCTISPEIESNSHYAAKEKKSG